MKTQAGLWTHRPSGRLEFTIAASCHVVGGDGPPIQVRLPESRCGAAVSTSNPQPDDREMRLGARAPLSAQCRRGRAWRMTYREAS
jgi:hypothetical protein